MRHHYYFVSPRGFVNEGSLYAVDEKYSRDFARMLGHRWDDDHRAQYVRVSVSAAQRRGTQGFWASDYDGDGTLETAKDAAERMLAEWREIADSAAPMVSTVDQLRQPNGRISVEDVRALLDNFQAIPDLAETFEALVEPLYEAKGAVDAWLQDPAQRSEATGALNQLLDALDAVDFDATVELVQGLAVATATKGSS